MFELAKTQVEREREKGVQKTISLMIFFFTKSLDWYKVIPFPFLLFVANLFCPFSCVALSKLIFLQLSQKAFRTTCVSWAIFARFESGRWLTQPISCHKRLKNSTKTSSCVKESHPKQKQKVGSFQANETANEGGLSQVQFCFNQDFLDNVKNQL